MSTDLFEAPARWRADIISDFRLRGAERCAAASPTPGFPQLLDSMMHALDGVAEGPWLDVGGGLGGAASWIERRDARPRYGRVIVIDPSMSSVRSAKRLFAPIVVTAATGEDLPIATGSVQVVLLGGVVSLLAEPEELLAEVCRVLAPDGRVVVTDLWSATPDTYTSERNTFHSLEDFTVVAERCGFRRLHVGVAQLTTGWWPTAAAQVDEEIAARHAGCPGYEEWRADTEHLHAVFESGRVMPAGVVLA